MKRCCTCKQTLPLDSFSKSRQNKDGLKKRCKSCCRKEYLKRKDRHLETCRIYRNAHKEYYQDYKKDWYTKNKIRLLQKAQEYYTQNKEEILERVRTYSSLNKEQIREKDKMAYRDDYAKNPEKYKMWGHIRRARKRNAFIEKVVPSLVYERDQWICSLCHTKVKKSEASLDHILPLSLGGEHSYRNTALAHLRCNISKGNRNRAQQQRLFG